MAERRTGAAAAAAKRATASEPAGLTVAVTGPTGEIGTAFLRQLDADPAIGRILGMARRPFDPAERGLTKVEYRQGDVLDRASIDALVAGADAVVHLAFLIMGDADEAHRINLEGSRNVFAATRDAEVSRLVYASSVAAYGFHPDRPERLTEDVAAIGSDAHYYSAQKAEVEQVLAETLAGGSTEAYVFRPCIVAGPEAPLLIRNIPYVQIAGQLPGAVRRLLDVVPILKPVIPDPGVPFQLVHADDVAQALLAAVKADGPPGVYNLAADGDLTMADLANALGWYSIPLPELAVDAAATAAKLPFVPDEATWIEAFREPVLMDTTRAKTELGWRPQHDAHATLAQTVAGARDAGLLR